MTLFTSSFSKVSVFTRPYRERERFQNDAFSNVSTFETVFESLRFHRRFSVDDRRKRIKKYAFSHTMSRKRLLLFIVVATITISVLSFVSRCSHLSCRSRCFDNLFLDIDRKYGRTALRLIRRHERCSRKLARYANHLTFLTRCIKNHIVPRDLQVRPPVPTKGARRVAELASMRFLRERIRLAQRAKGDVKKEAESTAETITSTLSAEDAAEVLDKIRSNTQ